MRGGGERAGEEGPVAVRHSLGEEVAEKDEVEGGRRVFLDYEEAAQGYTTAQDP